MNIMFGNKEPVAAVVLNDEMVFFFSRNFKFFDPKKSSNAVVIVDNIIAFIDIDEIF